MFILGLSFPGKRSYHYDVLRLTVVIIWHNWIGGQVDSCNEINTLWHVV